MQVKILINNKLYKTVTVEGSSYNPAEYWPQIDADKAAGLLSTFNVQEQMAVRFEPVK
jgi:urease beta subunit